MFYWDNFFMNIGLLQMPGYGKHAKAATDNLLALIEKHGFVPNCNLPWGRNRSQPPYLSVMVRDVYTAMPDKQWLKTSYDTLLKEYAFWTDESETPIEVHTTGLSSLIRYSNHGSEEEKLAFYDGALHERFGFSLDVERTEKLKIAESYMTEAETGMDFTPRFEHRCNEFAAVDLNVLIIMYERNFAWMEAELNLPPAKDWNQLGQARASAIQTYMWDPERGFYYDYDFVNCRRSKVACCTGFMPLWAGIATKSQAGRCRKALRLFEREWGVATCEPTVEAHPYQWQFPVCWAPHVQLTLLSLEQAGFARDARRIASKWMDVVAANFNHPASSNQLRDRALTARRQGSLFEKYEVLRGTIADSEYPAFQGNMWTAGAFVQAYHLLQRQNSYIRSVG